MVVLKRKYDAHLNFIPTKHLSSYIANREEKELLEFLTPSADFFNVKSFEKALMTFDDERFSEEQVAFFIDLKSLTERAEFFKSMFLNGESFACLAYAVKANPGEEVLKYLMKGGVDSFDCASLREIALVKKREATNSIFFNHPVKKRFEINKAFLNFQVNHFTIQSFEELSKIVSSLPAYCDYSSIEIVVRLRTQNNKSRINLSSKFGSSFEVSKDLLKASSLLGFKVGISVHTGSQNLDPSSYENALVEIERLISDLGHNISSINLGGGFPVNYEGVKYFDEKKYFKIVNSAIYSLIRRQKKYLNGTKYILEIGRALVANSSKLIVPILSRQARNADECLYLADGVFGSFSDGAVHKWRYSFDVLRNSSYLKEFTMKEFHLYGPTCDSGDDLGKYMLPASLNSATDRLLVNKAGAYMSCQASDFNYISAPRQIFYNF